VSHGKASAYLPVIELLRDYFRIVPEDDLRQRRQKVIGRVLELDRSLESILPYLFTLLGIQEGEDPLARMDAQIRRQRTQDALKRIFIRESLNQPLIVVFEDLHWIDSDTQAFLNLLADSIANVRILLLVNYRPEYHHEWGQRTHYAQLRLDPLGKESAEEMLDALLSAPAAAASDLATLKRFILDRTQGNPFFIEEIVQVLFDDGVLMRDGTVLRVARLPSLLHIPPTVQGVLAARIDRLPAEEKELLQTLAVIGREFPLALVGRVAPRLTASLDAMLSDLQRAEFIYEQSAFPDVEYIFKHALTQEELSIPCWSNGARSWTRRSQEPSNRCSRSTSTTTSKTSRSITAAAVIRSRPSNTCGPWASKRHRVHFLKKRFPSSKRPWALCPNWTMLQYATGTNWRFG
jgi:predicted ATPase